jgi:hypothetical protein
VPQPEAAEPEPETAEPEPETAEPEPETAEPPKRKWPLRALAVAETHPQGQTGRVGAGLVAGSPPR